MEPRKQKKTWRDSAPIDMFLSAVSVLVVVQLSLEVPKGLMNYPVCVCVCVYIYIHTFTHTHIFLIFFSQGAHILMCALFHAAAYGHSVKCL